MQNEDRAREQLMHELAELRKRVSELEAAEAEHKEMMEPLSQGKENYYDFFKNSKDALYSTGRDGRFVEVNQSFLNLFGYTREELGNLKTQETYVNQSDRYRFQQEIEQRGFVLDYAMRLCKKDGTELDCLVSATVRRANDGNVLGYQGIIRDTTEHKRAAKELRIKENAIASSINAIAMADLEGNLIYVNPSFRKLWGYEEKELLGRPAVEFWQEAEKALEVIEALRENGDWLGELTAKRKDGSAFCVQLSANMVADEIGNPICMMGSFVEITKQKRAEEALKESKERFRSLVEATSDWLWEVDQNGVYTYASPKVKELLGYEPEEIIGKTALDLMPSDEAERVGALFRDIVAFQRPLERLENVNLHKDGRRVFLETSGVPIFDNNENLLGYRGIDRDITERKRTEEALRESKELYRVLFENAPVGIGIAALDGRIVAGNKVMHQITGNSEEDIGKLNVRDIYVHPEDRDLLLRRFLRDGSVQEFETKMKRKDGTVYDASITVNRIIVDGENCILAMLRDITTHKEAEKKLINYQQQLRSLASALSLAEERERRHIATYLHDHIGHSLAICKIKLGLLRESLAPLFQDGYLDEIRELIEQAIQGTRSLTFELSPPVLYEMGLVPALESLAENVGQHCGIRVKVKDTDHLMKLGDDLKILLFQTTRELLTNVGKHAQARNVEIDIRRYEKKVQIRIQDDGVGFDTAQLLSVSTKNGGFGLFSIRERLHHVGGHCDIQSQPNGGTCVTIVAPLETKE